mgnify:CR=1 FL=1
MSSNEKTISQFDEHVVHSYGRMPVALKKGEGRRCVDENGVEYIDFGSGIGTNSLGYCDEKWADAVCAQVRTLQHNSNYYYTQVQADLAEKLCKVTGYRGIFFGNSGAEANEALIKLARKNGSEKGRCEIIVMNDSFHGRTLATLAATGRSKYRKGFSPDMPGFKFVNYNDIEAVRNAIDGKTAAVMLEPVQGEGGIIPADREYLKAVRELCDKNDIMLLFDEVQCGMGRTGSFFAWQSFGVEPDALSMAKALGNGYPIGAMVAKRKYSQVLTPGTHASTFGGTALASAAACAVIDAIDNEKVLDNVVKQSKVLMDGIAELSKKYPCIQGVRGKGLMVGAVLDQPAGKVLSILRGKGMIALSAGENVLRLVPPLNVSGDECRKALELIDSAFAELCSK